MGYVLLEGGSEFCGRMIEADSRALVLAGGPDAAVDIIPAAAAPDNNHYRAGQNGVEWFRRVGARKIMNRLLIDKASAQQPELAKQLAHSRLVFMLGGFPTHLAQSLAGTLCWQSICAVYHGGGVICGSSAGAMVFCEKFYDPFSQKIEKGLNIMPGICIIPHHDNTGFLWVKKLRRLLPDYLLLGIDEQTGIINDSPSGGWTVYGGGTAVLYRHADTERYPAGKIIPYTELPSPKLVLINKQ
jgi:cyanophycinase